jgi:hypothetical protein
MGGGGDKPQSPLEDREFVMSLKLLARDGGRAPPVVRSRLDTQAQAAQTRADVDRAVINAIALRSLEELVDRDVDTITLLCDAITAPSR